VPGLRYRLPTTSRVGAIVSLKNVDPESLALSTNAEFMGIIEQARREYAASQTISLSAMKKQLGV
jgi:hypothetical protein